MQAHTADVLRDCVSWLQRYDAARLEKMLAPDALPAALGISPGRPRWAQRFVFRIETSGDLVTEVQAIMASAKLTAVRFEPV